MGVNMPTSPTETQVHEFRIRIEQIQDFEYRVHFDKEHHEPLHMDEPEPLGKDRAPSASRVLAAAIGNCLSASLLFCLRKSRVEARGMQTEVLVRILRNERGRLRIGKVTVAIDPGIAEADRERAARCLSLFEDFCVVTQSVRQGIDVEVEVRGFPPPAG